MIETAMLVALGFCVATLLALAVLPFVTRRAARLAAERLADVVPVSADEIVAERDGLRATAAVEQRRLERKLAAAEASAAGRTAELGHRTAELAGLQELRQADEAARAALAVDFARLQEQSSGLTAERDDVRRQLDEAGAKLRDAEHAERALTSRRDALDALAEERRGAIAALETRCSGLEMRRDDLEAELRRDRAEQDRLRAALADMTRERDISRTEVQVVATQRAILQDDLTEATRRAETYRLRFDAKSEALDRAEQQRVTEKADRLAAQAAHADLKRRFERLEARLVAQAGQAAEASESGDLDALRAEIAGVADHALTVLGSAKAEAGVAAADPGGVTVARPDARSAP